MQELIELTKRQVAGLIVLPYAVVASVKEQRILNAPIMKPLLIFVFAGVKRLGKDDGFTCPAGHFLFLSSAPSIDMRNIPDGEYFALLIEFEHRDFDQFRGCKVVDGPVQFQGVMDNAMQLALRQFIEFPSYAPPELWPSRRQELLRLFYSWGYTGLGSVVERPSLSHRLHHIVAGSLSAQWTLARLASSLAISEPTLRRKLKAEGISVKTIVGRARLGHALYLVQTTLEPIGRVADACGFTSQSRFTEQFKQTFGLTPTALRKTRYRN